MTDEGAPPAMGPGTAVSRADGSRDRSHLASSHERLTAFLVGLVAVIAALLVSLEAAASHDGARAEAGAARLTAEITTRLSVSAAPLDFGLGRSLKASIVMAEGASRRDVSMDTADEAGEAIAAADAGAWERLVILALEMGGVPDASSPLDDYARTTLASTTDEIAALVEERNHLRDLADTASERSSSAVLALSLAALAGVLVGLAAVTGDSRPGRALLLLGYVLAGAAVVMGTISARWVPLS